jgi:hypothetical protein
MTIKSRLQIAQWGLMIVAVSGCTTLDWIKPDQAAAPFNLEQMNNSVESGATVTSAFDPNAPTLFDRAKSLLPDVSKDELKTGAVVAGVAYIASGNAPSVPNRTINLSSATSIALDKLVSWGGYVGAAYLILDPLAPNWEIEEASFPAQHYHLSLKMKRFYNGGAGEVQQFFKLRAQEIMLRSGYSQYAIVDYSESLESSLLGSQRVARGVIQLRKPAS